MAAVGHRRVDLDAAVDRPRVHHDRIGLGQPELVLGQPIVLEELAGTGQHRAAHAFVLQPQHDDHVGAAYAFGHVVADPHAHALEITRHQRLGADRADVGHAQRGQRVDVRARDPRVHDVADDGHRQLGEVLLVMPDRVHVEQALGRVRMAPVAGIDHMHMRRAVLGDQVGRTALAVANDEHVGVHRRQVGDGVEQALAFGSAALGDVEVDHVGRQPLGGDLESGAGAGRVLEEQVEHALAPQQRHLLDLAVVDRQKSACGVENLRDDLARQALDRQQMDQFALPVELGVALVQHVRLVPGPRK